MFYSNPSKEKELKNKQATEAYGEIPKEIHIMWVGKRIEDKYIKRTISLIAMSRKAGFTINIYVDKLSNYILTQMIDDIFLPKDKYRLIEINEEIHRIVRTYYDAKTQQRILKILTREMCGLWNGGN